MIGIADPASAGFDPERLARICVWMNAFVNEKKLAGSSILVARGGNIVLEHATGLRDRDRKEPFQRDTVARIYSMTKPITTTALMILSERGFFHLDAPISEFLPEFSECRALVPGAVTIDQTEPCPTPSLHQLATHTSGLSYSFNPGVLPASMVVEDLHFGPNQGLLGDHVNHLASLPLAFHPGTRWEYSVGIDVLGRVIEVVSGRSLNDFLREEILDPLGMLETGFSVTLGATCRFSALYTPLAGNAFDLNSAEIGDESLRLIDRPEASPFLRASLHSGGGGLVGTIDDYLKFVEMLRRGGALGDQRLLARNTVRFMTANHLPCEIASMGPKSFAEQPMEGMGFGLGGAVVLNPGRARCVGSIGDFSWGGMASTFFWMDPHEDLSVVFFTQLSPSSSYPIRPQLKALVHAALN
ncbi:serine hydrolase domain-containing protein [Pseudopelagicola sp. nBUS_20]|uniref:serine hydrolase domain-containing protein n=1 Tax=Pseudopelagicola sp. nBUS_20 TaxID=3395317 RepID=UPI003EB8122F